MVMKAVNIETIKQRILVESQICEKTSGGKNDQQYQLAKNSKPSEIGSTSAEKAMEISNKRITSKITQSPRHQGNDQRYKSGYDLREIAEGLEINQHNSHDLNIERVKETNPISLKLNKDNESSKEFLSRRVFKHQAYVIGPPQIGMCRQAKKYNTIWTQNVKAFQLKETIERRIGKEEPKSHIAQHQNRYRK